MAFFDRVLTALGIKKSKDPWGGTFQGWNAKAWGIK